MPKRSSNQPFNVYHAAEAGASLDSMEGVPAAQGPAADAEFFRWKWQHLWHRRLAEFSALLPGIALAGGLAFLATLIVRQLPWSAVSPILVTVVLGLLFRGAIGLPDVYRDGLRWCVKRVLQIGVMLLGLRLSLVAVGEIGFQVLPVILLCIASAVLVVSWVGRCLGISSSLSILIVVGSSICGVSAVVATGPAIRAKEEEVSFAVAVVTLFGLLALLSYPFLAHWLFAGDARMVAVFLGTAIHDTSQVAGAAVAYESSFGSSETLEVAATTKLTRNLCMGALIPLAAWYHQRQNAQSGGGVRLRWYQMLPPFILGFVLLAGLRSIGDLGGQAFGVLDRNTWEGLLEQSQSLSLACLTMAMAAVGLGTSVRQLRGLGWKPVVVGLTGALTVGAVSLGGIFLFVR